jgi:hypothetical protein
VSTLSDYNNALFVFFRENDTFDPDKDFPKIAPAIFDNEPLERAIALASAEAFEKQDLVKRVQVGNVSVFVLTKSLNRYSQTVEIPGEAVGSLAKVLNDFKVQSGWADFAADPLHISEEDIYHLRLLAQKALDTAEDWLPQIT